MLANLQEIQKALGAGNKYLRSFSIKQIVPETYREDDCFIICELILTEERIGTPCIVLSFGNVRNIEFRGGPYQTIRIVGMQIEEVPGCDVNSWRIRVASEDDISYLFFHCEGASFSGCTRPVGEAQE